ncbi:MAG: hypothetical protein WCT12_35550, partial [Verrucomicrobiota bacterium]
MRHLQRAEESRELAAYLLDVPPSLILDAASLGEIARVHQCRVVLDRAEAAYPGRLLTQEPPGCRNIVRLCRS